MKFLYCLALLCLMAHQGESLSIYNPIKSIIDQVEKSGSEAYQRIMDLIPSQEYLFTMSKDILLGMPEKAVLKGVNFYCSVMRSYGITPLITPDMNTMSLHLHIGCDETIFALEQAEDILKSPNFDVKKKVAIFVNGFMSTSEADYVYEMANAFACRGGYNFLALNSADIIHTLYTWSAYNTQEIGHRLAEALIKLSEVVPAENIHLIGHSLGSHIVGYAGRYFNNYTNLNISRITGLDPAFPCFSQNDQLFGLQRGDANFVDVIHTNPGVFGISNIVGDADFYAEGLMPIKPGCSMVGCSHFRAYKYFTETVYPGNEQNFLGKRCNSMADLKNGFCRGSEFPMGFDVPYKLTGNYFLPVNAEQPYGKNNEGRPAVPDQCVKSCSN